MEKFCSKCGLKLLSIIENFPPSKKSGDGFLSWCRICERKRDKVRKKKRSKETMNRRAHSRVLRISNSYVRKGLARSLGIKISQVPQELVEIKRNLIKLHRYANKKEASTSCSASNSG